MGKEENVVIILLHQQLKTEKNHLWNLCKSLVTRYP